MQQNNTQAAKKQFVVRLAAVTHTPMVVDATSRENGLLTAVVWNKEVKIGFDAYNSSEPVTPDVAEKIVAAFAKHHGLKEDAYTIRQRLPSEQPRKSGPRKARKTNDANLVLVKNEEKKTERAAHQQDYRSADEIKAGKPVENFEDTVQKMHDDATGMASAGNPHGATVKPTEHTVQADAPKQKRKYTRQDHASHSRKSQAALRRFERDLAAAAEKSKEMEAVTVEASKDLPEVDLDAAYAELGRAMAKIMQMNGGKL